MFQGIGSFKGLGLSGPALLVCTHACLCVDENSEAEGEGGGRKERARLQTRAFACDAFNLAITEAWSLAMLFSMVRHVMELIT